MHFQTYSFARLAWVSLYDTTPADVSMLLFLTLLSLVAPVALAQSPYDLKNVLLNPKKSPGEGFQGPTIPLDVSHLRNNKGFGISPGDANFDGNHFGYPGQEMPPSQLSLGGVNFDFAQIGDSDSVLAQGQSVDVPKGRYIGVQALVAADLGIVEGTFEMSYDDGSTSTSTSMQTLAGMGTEIMWCDIGGTNLTPEFAAAWFNQACSEGRQVVMNNRCAVPGDCDTPEYTTYTAVKGRKWESSRGMDPHSYGYNRATPASGYMNSTTVVHSIVDVASKNGNYLLDVGPTAEGEIIQAEQDNLRDAGLWLRDHAEAVYNTTYWYVTPREGFLRFTQNDQAFYISVLETVNETLTTHSPVPFMDGDKVGVVGGNNSGTVVPATLQQDGSLSLNAVKTGDRLAWVFKIPFDEGSA